VATTRQIEANRRNAARSTGPTSTGGKARSSQNALRHGLAKRRSGEVVGMDSLIGAMTSSLGRQIGPDSTLDLIRCRLAVLRIRRVRHEMLAAVLQYPAAAGLKRLQGLERYERAALVQLKRALRHEQTDSG
jgi:hypothetical protein